MKKLIEGTPHKNNFCTGKRGRLFRSLNRVLASNNKLPVTGMKKVSNVTQRDRERILGKFCNDLHELGHKVIDVHQIRTRHVQAVIKEMGRGKDLRGHLR